MSNLMPILWSFFVAGLGFIAGWIFHRILVYDPMVKDLRGRLDLMAHMTVRNGDPDDHR